ncbi:MAG: diaminopimelate epimerase [Polyangiaceae bacterium]|nr:diaminopimelate epimerase [Polyangiaceae bacterium]
MAGPSLLTFEKYEGLGNDFVVVTAPNDDDVSPARAVALCDRRRGVGADGVLVVLPPRRAGADVRMRVINADGSIPEMCGNGVRCVALAVARQRGLRGGVVRVDTDAGLRSCVVTGGDGEGIVTVDMGVIRVIGERTVDVGGEVVSLTTADAGNPHAVLFGVFTPRDVERLGPRLSAHSDFERGTNVGFAHVVEHEGARDGCAVDLVVWERGVGVTLACGTGACATAAIACAKGLAPFGVPVEVRLPGGRLDVTIDADGRATMRGPARFVFSGTTPL